MLSLGRIYFNGYLFLILIKKNTLRVERFCKFNLPRRVKVT